MFLRRRDVVWLALLVGRRVGALDDGDLVQRLAWRGGDSRAPIVAAGRCSRSRRLAAAAGGVALWQGPLAGRLVRMDAEWLAAIGEKDLFPLAWPADVWLTNLVAIPIILSCWRARRSRRS